MSNVTLQHISKRYGDILALDDVSLDIQDGEFFVLLGPTGAGKTTTLRVIAGLEKQTAGTVIFDGEVVDGVQPADRDVAFVFQQYSLYPSMTVYDNLAFPLRSPIRRTPEPEIRKRIEAAADILRITHLLERKTARLSGGEMQRVSIGRAIVRSPRIFLMDEPLSNLDAKLRESLRVELKHIQKVQNSTTVFVTHDQIEALTMADRIGVLEHGRLLQVGTPEDIYDRPATTFVAQLVGTPRINLLQTERSNGSLHVAQSDLTLPTPAAHVPDRLLIGVRPEDVRIQPNGAFEGHVSLMEPLGVETIVHIRCGSQTLTSTVSGVVTLLIGEVVRFDLFPDHVHYFDLNGQRL